MEFCKMSVINAFRKCKWLPVDGQSSQRELNKQGKIILKV